MSNHSYLCLSTALHTQSKRDIHTNITHHIEFSQFLFVGGGEPGHTT